ncbi:19193_t:CDS:2 [Entrophospora sp. SA101]|nr:19193_t:CDS:2 [Entrophospora sp. SA101]CAJ0869092.1 11258_t:CDS:2 [Entrophospora sp. SA101]
MENKIIAQAKKHLHNYKIIEKFIAGIVLTGNEIKSLRNYQTVISESYILPQQGELFITNMHINAYKYSQATKLEIALAQPLRKYQIKEKIKEKEIKRRLREESFW